LGYGQAPVMHWHRPFFCNIFNIITKKFKSLLFFSTGFSNRSSNNFTNNGQPHSKNK